MEAEKKDRKFVKLRTSGVYPLIPIKAEYKQKGVYDTMTVRFLVQLGSRFSCTVFKTVFFKTMEQANAEIQYLLKFICPDLLNQASNAATFKEYVEQISAIINKEFDKQKAEGKKRDLVYGKILIKKDKNFEELPDHVGKDGQKINYLATLDNLHDISYYTEWEANNCIVPFEIMPDREPEANGYTAAAIDAAAGAAKNFFGFGGKSDSGLPI